MFTVYILRSVKTNKYYIGQTKNINRRLGDHNAGRSKSTKSARPWTLIYTEHFATRSEAAQREQYLKSFKSRVRIERLIKETRGGAVVAR